MKVIWGLMAAMLVAGPGPAWADPTASIAEMAQTPLITLRIAENLRRPPDQATITVTMRSKAPTASAALAANKLKIAKLVATIGAAGIGAKDIQTEGVNIGPDYRYDQVAGRGQQRLVGYSASNSVRARTRRIDGLSTLLDALAAAGADEVYGPRFEIYDPAPLRSQVRRLAMQRGLAEAREYALNAGFARVQLLSVAEGISSRSSDAVIVSGSRMDGLQPPAPPAPPPPPGGDGSIQPGQIETGVILTLTYRMER